MWYIGQKIVCVNVTPGIYSKPGVLYLSDNLSGLTKDRVYTIRDILKPAKIHDLGFKLVEIHRGKDDYVPFDARRFRPLNEEGMSILRSIAENPVKKLEDA